MNYKSIIHYIYIYELIVIYLIRGFQKRNNENLPSFLHVVSAHAAAPRNQFEVAEKKMQALLKARPCAIAIPCHLLPCCGTKTVQDTRQLNSIWRSMATWCMNR